MRVLLPLAVLTLAACDPPMQEIFPARFHAFEREGIVYEARAQYDPFERGWFVRVTSIEVPMDEDDLDLALSLAETEVGPLVCEGDLLDVEPGEVWNPWAGDQIEFLDDLATWHLVGRCTDTPAPAALVTAPGPVVDPDVVIAVEGDE